jgi:hypothetical protein
MMTVVRFFSECERGSLVQRESQKFGYACDVGLSQPFNCPRSCQCALGDRKSALRIDSIQQKDFFILSRPSQAVDHLVALVCFPKHENFQS